MSRKTESIVVSPVYIRDFKTGDILSTSKPEDRPWKRKINIWRSQPQIRTEKRIVIAVSAVALTVSPITIVDRLYWWWTKRRIANVSKTHS